MMQWIVSKFLYKEKNEKDLTRSYDTVDYTNGTQKQNDNTKYRQNVQLHSDWEPT